VGFLILPFKNESIFSSSLNAKSIRFQRTARLPGEAGDSFSFPRVV
jgi:hypothetical protein